MHYDLSIKNQSLKFVFLLDLLRSTMIPLLKMVWLLLYVYNIFLIYFNIYIASCLSSEYLNATEIDEQRETFIQIKNKVGSVHFRKLSSNLISASRVKIIEKIGQGEQWACVMLHSITCITVLN